MKNSSVAIGLIILGVVTRLLPHQPNFTAVGAITLFAGMYLPRPYALLIPVGVLALTDPFLGVHPTIGWVYGSFLLVAIFTFALKNLFKGKSFFLLPFYSSMIFFIVSNVGVWLTGDMYARTWQGLQECFMMALPFLRGTFAGDMFYASVLWGAMNALPIWRAMRVPQMVHSSRRFLWQFSRL